jgi:hypothetical protein
VLYWRAIFITPRARQEREPVTKKEKKMMLPQRSIVVATLILLTTSSAVTAADEPGCQRVQGFLEETLVTTGCLSPVGLCTVARVFGTLKGEARFTASTIAPSEEATTGVVFVSGDTTLVNAQLGNKRGTLLIKDAAAYQTIADGNLVDIQTIIGGTGNFSGATGTLRISGNFLSDSGGSSNFEGTVCVP